MTLKPETRQTVDRVLVSLTQMLTQRELVSDRILARVNVLMEHYFVAQTADKVTVAKFMDWYNALKKYPFWAIDEGCRQWMATERRKPTIADINQLAINAIDEPSRMLQRLTVISATVDEDAKPNGKGWGDMTEGEQAIHNQMMAQIKATSEGMKA